MKILDINKNLLALLSVIIVSCSPKAEHTEHTSHKEKEEEMVHISLKQIKAANIVIGNIEHREISSTIRVNGSLKVPKTHKGYVTTLYGGSIVRIHTMPGQYVRKGQLIATLANPEFIQLQEEYLTTRSKIQYAQEELTRQKTLSTSGAGSTKNLQMAESELSSLRANYASLEHRLQLAGVSPKHISSENISPTLSIYSPINGIISEVLGQIGSYIAPSSPIAEVIDNSSLHLDLNIYEQDLPNIQIGQIVHFRLTNNSQKEYKAKVYNIGSTFEPDRRTIAVHCNILNDKTGLIDGMNITGIVSLDNKLLPTVPDEAIIHTDGKDYIFAQYTSGHNHKDMLEFVPIEVIKGVSQLGYTAITPLVDIDKDRQIVLKGAFFVNALLRESEMEHNH